MNLFKTTAVFFLLFATAIVKGQITSSTMDLIVAYQYSKSDKVAFINGNEGSLISKVETEEPIYWVSVDTENDTFFIQTRHFLQKGIVSTGEVTEKQRVYEDEKTIKNVNFDNMIIPGGVNKDGVAMWTYNKELVDLQKQQLNTKNVFKIGKIAKKVNKVMNKPTPYVVYDFMTKETTEYGAFNPLQKYPYALMGDDNVWFYNRAVGTLSLNERVSNKALKTYDIEAALKLNPEFQEYAKKPGVPNSVSEHRFAMTFNGINPDNLDESITILCDNKLRRVVSSYKTTDPNFTYPLSFIDSDRFVYAKTKSTFKDPKPQMPTAPKIGAFGAKKKLKAYQAKLDQYTADHQVWLDNRFNSENANLVIYKDTDCKEEILTVEGVGIGQVFNNDFLLITKEDKVVLYDLSSATEKWSISL